MLHSDLFLTIYPLYVIKQWGAKLCMKQFYEVLLFQAAGGGFRICLCLTDLPQTDLLVQFK